MSKSLSAKIMSELLKFWPKLTAEETEHVLEKAMQREETKIPAPLTIKTRHEDSENGRIFYHKGIREIPMNDLVRPVLEEAIEKAPRNKYGLIFYDTNKKDVIATQQVNCYFKRLCHKANIDVRGQHALRHTFATRCIEAGIPAVVLKEWMGHTNIHITLDTYADVFNRMNNEAIKMFEKYTCAIKYVEKTT